MIEFLFIDLDDTITGHTGLEDKLDELIYYFTMKRFHLEE